MLAVDSEEHREFFEPEREAYYFSNVEEACVKCRMILEMPDKEIAAIRANARKRCVESDYSYLHRARQAVAIIEKHL